jgi:hypothetical protein
MHKIFPIPKIIIFMGMEGGHFQKPFNTKIQYTGWYKSHLTLGETC